MYSRSVRAYLCVGASRAPTRTVLSDTSIASSCVETKEATMLDNEVCNDVVLMFSVLSVLNDGDGVGQVLEDEAVMLALYSDEDEGVVGR